MKVSELISILQTLPPEDEINVNWEDDDQSLCDSPVIYQDDYPGQWIITGACLAAYWTWTKPIN